MKSHREIDQEIAQRREYLASDACKARGVGERLNTLSAIDDLQDLKDRTHPDGSPRNTGMAEFTMNHAIFCAIRECKSEHGENCTELTCALAWKVGRNDPDIMGMF